MSRLFYLAHPVSGDVVANCARAARWLGGLMRALPDDTVIAPWIAALGSGQDDADPAQRERGLRDCERTVERCDGFIACGGDWSTGMLRELGVAKRRGLVVADLTGLGDPLFLDVSRIDLARIVAERSVRVTPTVAAPAYMAPERIAPMPHGPFEQVGNHVVAGVRFSSVEQLCAAYEHALATMGRMVWAFADLAKSHSVPRQQRALADTRALLCAAGKDVP